MINLNNEQRVAAEATDKNVLVLAGAGTGKTTTLVGRYAFLLNQSVPPEAIFCATFTRKAADEMLHRLRNQLKVDLSEALVGTFHSLAVRILRQLGNSIGLKPDFEIWSRDWERYKAINDIQALDNIAPLYEGASWEDRSASSILQYIDNARENLIDPEDASVIASQSGSAIQAANAEVYALYDSFLDEHNKADFPRLVQWACKALRNDLAGPRSFCGPIQHVLVDEYQDINAAQKEMIDCLRESGTSLWCVGDDYQAIYSWRGSDVRYILDFKKDSPDANILSLSANYRSGKSILKAANSLSSEFKTPYRHTLKSQRDQGGEVLLDVYDSGSGESRGVSNSISERLSNGVPANEIAVLTRTNRIASEIVLQLVRDEIPLSLQGGTNLFPDYEGKLLLSALANANEESLHRRLSVAVRPDLLQFAKKLQSEPFAAQVKSLAGFIANRPPQSLNQKRVEARSRLVQEYRDYFLSFKTAEKLFGSLAKVSDTKKQEGVFIGTVHSAKGLEWDTVIAPAWDDGVLPQRQDEDPKIFEEERRIAYVAVTRAKNCLLISHAQQRRGRDQEPSPFISELLDVDISQHIAVRNVREAQPPATQKTAKSEVPKDQTKSADKRQAKTSSTKNDDPLYDVSFDNAEKNNSLPKANFDMRTMTAEQMAAWKSELKLAKAKEETRRQAEREAEISRRIADGLGGGGGWSDQAAQTGLLAEAGYNVRKDGPDERVRHGILRDVFMGRVSVPSWMPETVVNQWGEPGSSDRLAKIRNTINVALGNQKGRQEPSEQAVKKWEADLTYIDQKLATLAPSKSEKGFEGA